MMHIIKTPSGNYTVVGNVPIDLMYDGLTTNEKEVLTHCGASLLSKKAKAKARTFRTKESIVSFLDKLGYRDLLSSHVQ